MIGTPRALGQFRAPPRNDDRPQQQRLHARGEDRVACLDGVLAVAQLVRETDLPEIGVSLLGAVEIGDPDAGSMTIQHIGHDSGSAAVADDVNDHGLVLEHPVPVGAAIDAHGGLVGADDARTAQSGQDRRDLVVEAGLGTAEHGIQRAFADLQGKQVLKQPAQPLIADRMREAQIDRHRQDVHAEWRTRLQALRDRCQSHTAATQATPNISLHPRHHRPDWAADQPCRKDRAAPARHRSAQPGSACRPAPWR